MQNRKDRFDSMTEHKDTSAATFVSDATQLEAATHYGPNMGKGSPERIAERDRCPICNGTIALVTETGVRATFVRLHQACVPTMKKRLGEIDQ